LILQNPFIFNLTFSRVRFLLFVLLMVVAELGFAQRNRNRMPDQAQAEELFVEGMKYDMLEQYKKAIEYFEKARNLNPNNAAIYFKLADCYGRLNQHEEALLNAQKALEIDGSNEIYYNLVGHLHEIRNELPKAEKVYLKLLKKNPESVEFNFQLASVYARQKKWKEAIECFNRLEKKYGVMEDIVRRKQEIYLVQNKLGEALKEAQKLVEAFPGEPTYQIILAQLLSSTKKYAEAEAILVKLVEQHGTLPEARLLLSDVYLMQGKKVKADKELEYAFRNPDLSVDEKVRIMARFLTGFKSKEEKDYALRFGSYMVEVHPESATPLSLMGDFHNLANEREQARDFYLRAIQKDNSKYQLWEQVVQIDLVLNDLDSLYKHTTAASELFPNQAVFWFYNGMSALVKSKYKESVNALKQASRLASDNKQMLAEIHPQLGDAYAQLLDYRNAFEQYDEALKLQPDNHHVLNNYAYYLSLKKQNLDKARNMSQKLVEVFPEDGTYLDTHGWVLYVLGDYAGAKPFLEKAANLSDKSGVVQEHYGDVLFKLGDVSGALAQWKKAKAIGGELSEFIDRKIEEKALIE
jgi:tetratricopeptide (TPR) repeat protein